MARATSAKKKEAAASSAPGAEPAGAVYAIEQIPAPASAPTGEGVERMIAVSAYYRAERRGFAPGHELEDWLAAEAEITSATLQKAAAPAEPH